MRSVLVLAIASAGCSAIIGIDDVTLGDGGGGDDAPPNTVVGTSAIRCQTVDMPDGVDTPVDRSTLMIAALIPDASQPTGYRKVVGQGNADGTFKIENVPDGMEYILELGNAYYVTDQHTIDDHFLEPLRCTPKIAVATANPALAVSLSNQTTFVNTHDRVTDFIQLDSFATAYEGFPDGADGATALTTTYDWRTSASFADGTSVLPDASKGDDLAITHLRGEPVSGVAREHILTHVIDTFSSNAVTVADSDTATPVTGAFQPAADNQGFQMTFNRQPFAAMFDDTTSFSFAQAGLLVHPVPTDFGVGIPLATLTFNDWSRSSSLVEQFNVSYADPYPASYTRFATVSYQQPRPITLPGATVPLASGFGYTSNKKYTGGKPSFTPTITAPKNIKIADLPIGLGGKVAFDGIAPVHVSWDAATGVKVYILSVRRIIVDSTTNRIRNTGSTSLTTTHTSFDVPAEVFANADFVEILLQAGSTPSDYAKGEINSNNIPSEFIVTSSGRFRFTSTCGDGHVDLGEECDTAGESATCNADCTLAKCGDGVLNTHANEQCDTIRDSVTCNAGTCKLGTCGDGYVNTQLEDCDDGNTTDEGNGCSTNCKFNNTCGDGKLESQAEACDSSGIDTTTCNQNCTVPTCGDGHLNGPAGEQCDDGNFDDKHDHCNSSCQNITPSFADVVDWLH